MYDPFFLGRCSACVHEFLLASEHASGASREQSGDGCTGNKFTAVRAKCTR